MCVISLCMSVCIIEQWTLTWPLDLGNEFLHVESTFKLLGKNIPNIKEDFPILTVIPLRASGQVPPNPVSLLKTTLDSEQLRSAAKRDSKELCLN